MESEDRDGFNSITNQLYRSMANEDDTETTSLQRTVSNVQNVDGANVSVEHVGERFHPTKMVRGLILMC